MLERELKFHVPLHKRAALEKELRQWHATHVPLHACYFDTEDHELATAKIALRVRKEGDHWIQTLKSPGPDELSRNEINHPRPDRTLDLSLYEGTSVEKTLTKLQAPLTLRYETVVDRLVLIRKTKTSTIEFAYDQGIIKAGELELPICELELELMAGGTDPLFEEAEQWLRKFGLILDLRSKAERGDALARVASSIDATAPRVQSLSSAVQFAPLCKPRRAGTITLEPELSMPAAYRLCANDCMNQIIRNATFLAGVDASDTAEITRVEYVHQLRVGIRRIRSCWRFFKKWVDINEAELGAELHRHFLVLGQARDADVVELVVTPRLIAAGMPALTLPTHDLIDHTQALAASADFQAILLTLLNHLLVVDAPGGLQESVESRLPVDQKIQDKGETAKPSQTESGKKLGKEFSKRLNKRLDALCQQGIHFVHLPIEGQHRLRKRVKGLRYSMEFAASLLSNKSFSALRDTLTDAQHTMGDLNDLYMAEDYYLRLAESQTQALFAVGWLRAMQEQKKAEAEEKFIRLSKAGHFKKA
ncbi:CYTH and CHAD domain-containing protein [Candidimonas sp. SYP-B2681]|uniref:CYTH and CHAD domain-containing protein n=1 Tax=Candidimonas sp. SYP-B2681 TaxID=2497686 RepID=UPI000F861D58|nr:CYTH and CHAD domain-containing protein [Candidimonas sp. SYP-B2681]RTZ39991.1 CYTH and CHAD domain-containing protein [Candidimonas sp. SYP-B2681]